MNFDRVHSGRRWPAFAALAPAVLFSLALTSCEFGTAPGFTPTAPQISYASTLVDTVGRDAAHSVQSTGGVVSRFEISPSLPGGLVFDTTTGMISGMPSFLATPRDYSVIATGPQGADTAVFKLWVVYPLLGVLPPIIHYPSPVVDTIGKSAVHVATSMAGAVTSYKLVSALPTGYKLDAKTGKISGTPKSSFAPTDFGVAATGPGGTDTVYLRLAVVPQPSKLPTAKPPVIAYDSPLSDTMWMAGSHAPLSTGGQVTSYAIVYSSIMTTEMIPDMMLSPMPLGMSLNPVTGIISGTPTSITMLHKAGRSALTIIDPAPGGTTPVMGNPYTTYSYLVEATGPGGKDTAQVVHRVYQYGGWTSNPPTSTGSRLNLTVNLPGLLNHRKVIVTITSNVSSDQPLIDTVVSSMSTVAKSYEVKPLRHFTVSVKAIDALDSVTHTGTATATSVMAGETRAVTLTATARYQTYAVRFNLPDSIGSMTSLVKQPISFYRAVVQVDGKTLADSTKNSGYFATAPTTHTLAVKSVRPVTQMWTVMIYADIVDWPSTLPVFVGTAWLDTSATSATVNMTWSGPGSPSDPDTEGGFGTGGSPITTLPIVTIEKTSAIVVQGWEPPNPLP